MILVREPDAGNPPVRFDEREVETAHTAPPLDSTGSLMEEADGRAITRNVSEGEP